MRVHTQGLLDPCATARTILAGVLRCHCNDCNIMQECIVLEPLQEDPPACVLDRFGEFAVANQVDRVHMEGTPIHPRLKRTGLSDPML